MVTCTSELVCIVLFYSKYQIHIYHKGLGTCFYWFKLSCLVLLKWIRNKQYTHKEIKDNEGMEAERLTRKTSFDKE